MNETYYALYKLARRVIERAEKSRFNENETVKYFKSGIASFDESKKGYAERYEKEKNDGSV